MNNSNEQVAQQDVPELKIFRGEEDEVGIHRFDRQERLEREEVEAFWAGRTLAMRRSARAAA